jgi:hypothetical protein
MLAHKRYVTIPSSGNLVLEDLPFRPGELVEVVVISDEGERATLAARFRDLLKQTQAMPGAATITDAEIAAEVDAVRDGR